MDQNSENKFPIIKNGENGYWHAYGEGWAVCAQTQEAVLEKYQEMLNLINELATLTPKNSGDIL